jgi:hypothetical protein
MLVHDDVPWTNRHQSPARLDPVDESRLTGNWRQRMAEIAPGRYLHYKGKEYTVLGVARHSETLEELVVYRQEYGDRGLWVRPAEMFTETVMVDGTSVPRFTACAGPASGG